MSVTGTTVDSLVLITGAASGRVRAQGTTANSLLFAGAAASGRVVASGTSTDSLLFSGAASGWWVEDAGTSVRSLQLLGASTGAFQVRASTVKSLGLLGGSAGVVVPAAVLNSVCALYQAPFSAPNAHTAIVPLSGGITVTGYLLPVANPQQLPFNVSLDVSPDGINFVSAGSFKVLGDRTTLVQFTVINVVASYARLTLLDQNQGANGLTASAWISAR